MRTWQGFSKAFCGLGLALAAMASAQPGGVPFLALSEVIKGDETPLRWPVAVVAPADDEVAVADVKGNRIVVFRDEGGGTGWKQSAEAALPSAPYSLAFDGESYLVSLRGDGGLMALERPQLQLRRMALPPGVVPGALAQGPGGLLLHDLATGRVLLIDREGEIRSEVSVRGRVTALVAGGDGGFHVTVAEPAAVLSFDAAGQLLSDWPVPGLAPESAWPSGLVVEPNGDRIIADQHGGRIVRLDGSGRLSGWGSRRGWEPGLLRYPSGLARFPDGRIVVADRGNGKIQIFGRLEESSRP